MRLGVLELSLTCVCSVMTAAACLCQVLASPLQYTPQGEACCNPAPLGGFAIANMATSSTSPVGAGAEGALVATPQEEAPAVALAGAGQALAVAALASSPAAGAGWWVLHSIVR